MANEVSFTPIGIYRSTQVHPYEAGRQPDEFHSEGVIELNTGSNFEQAVDGLEGCKKIWVLFLFHHNNHWNPMVLPPRGRDSKIGVFATRSPYRPNPIGMSCVDIVSIDKLKIKVRGADLLDGTPVLDLKPYVAYADSFPGEEPEWLKSAEKFEIQFSSLTQEMLSWLEKQGLSQLRSFLIHQLEYEPTNSKKKRVKEHPAGYVIAYRTWRAAFAVSGNTVVVDSIYSGYSTEDLANQEDPYLDKDLHRHFIKAF